MNIQCFSCEKDVKPEKYYQQGTYLTHYKFLICDQCYQTHHLGFAPTMFDKIESHCKGLKISLPKIEEGSLLPLHP